jgi:flagellar hook-associated protein 1 FlgK
MSDLMRIGSSAMNAAYAQLQVTGQNIANAATPGYVRREVTLQESGNMSPEGWIGRGVDVAGVRRIYDQFLVREAAAGKAAAAQDGTRSTALGGLERLFADPATGVGAAYDELVAAFGDVAARPSDPAARTAALARADAFAQRVSTLDARIVELREAAHGRMRNEVDRASDTLAALATVNRRIADARGALGEPNALLDERDRLLETLNGTLRATATLAEDGTVNVTTQRGEPLVVGGTASRLQLTADPLDASRMNVAVLRANGATMQIAAADVGGALGGLLRFSSEDVAAARAQLGQLAGAAAGAFNARQAVGLDAGGQPGQPLFAVGAPGVSAATTNAGGAQFTVQVADPAALEASDYELAWSGTQYTLTRLADGTQSVFASLPQSVDGLTLAAASGTPAAGDRFLVRAASSFAAGTRALQTHPMRIASALPVAAETGAANAGDLRAAALDVTAIGTNTTQPVTVTFTGPGTFDVSGTGTGNPTGLAYVPGMSLSFNGWTVTLEGSPAAGDTLRIAATANPAADNRNARAMQALGDATIVAGAGVIDRYAALVGDVGSRAQSAQAATDMSDRLLEDAERARSELSGVNLDEEAARLLQHQQAYQAAAKIVATANEMFRALLDAAG